MAVQKLNSGSRYLDLLGNLDSASGVSILLNEALVDRIISLADSMPSKGIFRARLKCS